jgi:hypothetical protein
MLIWTVLFSLIEAYRNYYLIKRRVDPHAWDTWLLRITIFTLINVMYGVTILNVLCTMIVFWFLFDTSLNILRRKPVAYLGNHLLDRLQKKLPQTAVWVWKGILAIVAGCYLVNPELFEL